MGLLDEIQQDALDQSIPIADTLRKLVALGGRTGSRELREWATRELRGYQGTTEELPKFRKPSAILKIDAINGNTKITGQQVSPRSLPEGIREHVAEEVPLIHSIGEIEALRDQARRNGGHISMTMPHSADVISLMNYEIGDPFQNIMAIYWSLSEPALQGVIDHVRTTLVELVAEMQAGTPADKALPSAEVADQAVNIAVHGKGARIHVASSQASGSGSHQVTGTSTVPNGGRRWARIGGGIVGLATIVGVVVAVLQWQGWTLW